LLVVCPINPFWWPVKPDLAKAAALALVGQYKDEHYRSFYFHHASSEADEKYQTYIDAIVHGVRTFMQGRDVFPIMVGMERLDRGACEDVAARLGVDSPLFISDDYNMYELVSVLRRCSWMLSSRFHAIVTSMPGLLPSAGITMDERIRNLMNDRDHPHLFLEVDEDDLADKVAGVLERLDADSEKIRDDIGRTIPRQLELMGEMGIEFADEVARVYPDFPRKDLPRTWQAHLPSLSPELQGLMERWG
jgi:polysaccharide pyruvyl transferase WcaK-like protein